MLNTLSMTPGLHLQPLDDGGALICIALDRRDGVCHEIVRDRASEVVRKVPCVIVQDDLSDPSGLPSISDVMSLLHVRKLIVAPARREPHRCTCFDKVSGCSCELGTVAGGARLAVNNVRFAHGAKLFDTKSSR